MHILRSTYDEGLGDDKPYVAMVSDIDVENKKVNPVQVEVEEEEPSDGEMYLDYPGFKFICPTNFSVWTNAWYDFVKVSNPKV